MSLLLSIVEFQFDVAGMWAAIFVPLPGPAFPADPVPKSVGGSENLCE
jgi:hypothetical protein